MQKMESKKGTHKVPRGPNVHLPICPANACAKGCTKTPHESRTDESEHCKGYVHRSKKLPCRGKLRKNNLLMSYDGIGSKHAQARGL